MGTYKKQTVIDVERAAVVRLLSMAKQRCAEAEEEGANYVSTWWGGYVRALEEILGMEME
jgi:hypothetical protein